MRARLAILAALALAACGKEKVHSPGDVVFPTLPDLSAETAKDCPPAEPVDGSLGDLATKDTSLSIEYARCQARHASAVGAYQTAQRLLAAAEAEQKRKDADKPPAQHR